MKRKSTRCLMATASALVGAMAASYAWAQEDVNVSINTSSLAGDTGSELFIELTGGSGDSGVGYNTVTTSPFALGTGTAGAVDTANSFGNVSGDMSSGISLNDNGSPLSLFGEFLTPGTSLSFQLDMTTNVNIGAVPDGLYLFIYDPNGNPIATTQDPSGFDSLLAVNFNSPTPVITTYPNVDGSQLTSVTPAGVVAAPEIDASSSIGALTLLAGLLLILRSVSQGRQRERRGRQCSADASMT